MAFAVIAFLVAFLLIGSGGLLIFYRDRIQERISSALYPRANKKTISTTIEETRHVIAGFRSDTAVKTFYGAKVMTPAFLILLSWVTGAIHLSPFFILTLAGGLGFLAPDLWLGRKIANRQKQMRKGLPDVLDLLVI